MKDAEVCALYKLRCTSRAIEKMEEKAAFLVREADKLRHQKQNAEYQLEQLNVEMEKIWEAG